MISHFAQMMELNLFALGTQFLHRSLLLVTSGRCPTPSFRMSFCSSFGVTFIFFAGGDGKHAGRPLGTFPDSIKLSDNIAMNVLSFIGFVLSCAHWRLWIFHPFTTDVDGMVKYV